MSDNIQEKKTTSTLNRDHLTNSSKMKKHRDLNY
jgi:hypothetical protein